MLGSERGTFQSGDHFPHRKYLWKWCLFLRPSEVAVKSQVNLFPSHCEWKNYEQILHQLVPIGNSKTLYSLYINGCKLWVYNWINHLSTGAGFLPYRGNSSVPGRHRLSCHACWRLRHPLWPSQMLPVFVGLGTGVKPWNWEDLMTNGKNKIRLELGKCG